MPFSKSIFVKKFAFLTLLALPVITHAAIAPLSEKEKTKQSTHIVVGKVIEITSSSKKSNVEKAVGIHRDRNFEITVLVESVEKGTGIEKGKSILVLAWQPSMRIPPLAGPQGHEGIPEKDDQVKLFLKKIEGKRAYTPLLPNGIETKE